MKGTKKFKPGVRVPLYLPRRSTTHACCCGTTLIDWVMKITAMTNKTIATSINFSGNLFGNFSKFLDDQSTADDFNNAVSAGRRCCAGDQRPLPIGATVLHRTGAVRCPNLNVQGLADIQIDIAVGTGRQRGRRLLLIATPGYDAGTTNDGCDHQLHWCCKPQMGSDRCGDKPQ